MNKIRIQAMIYATCAVLLLIAFFTYSISQSKKRVLDEKTSSHRELLKNAFELSILDSEKGLNHFACKMIADRRIVDAFESGDRKALYALAMPYFQESHLRGEADLSGFIRADGVHFLRLQDPKKFGDNIAKKRPMIAQAIQTRSPLTSLDVTLYNISLVTILPITKEGKFLGVLQTSVNINRIQERLNAHSGIKSALAFDSKILHDILPSAHTLKKYTDYSIISSNDPLFDRLPEDYAFDYSMRHTLNNKTYIVASRELKTYSNKPIARMICSLDITQDETSYVHEITNLLIASTVLVIFLVLILHFGFKTLIVRINRKSSDLNAKLREQLYTDALTNLSNRKALIQAIRNQKHYAVLLVNIDDFKEINDLYGHDIGDKLLQTLAQSIRKVAQTYNLIPYKMPSDEYALLLGENLTTEAFDQMCQEVLASLNETYYKIDDITIFTNISMGASFSTDSAV